MPSWRYRLDVSDVFHDDGRTFEERRDIIVARIKAAPFYESRWGDWDLLVDIVDRLADSPEGDTFDEAWSEFYDWADYAHRVWIATREWQAAAR
jgi:hypothetical protein